MRNFLGPLQLSYICRGFEHQTFVCTGGASCTHRPFYQITIPLPHKKYTLPNTFSIFFFFSRFFPPFFPFSSSPGVFCRSLCFLFVPLLHACKKLFVIRCKHCVLSDKKGMAKSLDKRASHGDSQQRISQLTMSDSPDGGGWCSLNNTSCYCQHFTQQLAVQVRAYQDPRYLKTIVNKPNQLVCYIFLNSEKLSMSWLLETTKCRKHGEIMFLDTGRVAGWLGWFQGCFPLEFIWNVLPPSSALWKQSGKEWRNLAKKYWHPTKSTLETFRQKSEFPETSFELKTLEHSQ